MSSAVLPPPPARRSRLRQVAIVSLVVITVLAGLFGAVHLYARYAQSVGPVPTRQHTAEKSAPVEKTKTPKSGASEKSGTPAATDDGTDTGEQAGGGKARPKVTSTPGA
jgi:hypothetical protein